MHHWLNIVVPCFFEPCLFGPCVLARVSILFLAIVVVTLLGTLLLNTLFVLVYYFCACVLSNVERSAIGCVADQEGGGGPA